MVQMSSEGRKFAATVHSASVHSYRSSLTFNGWIADTMQHAADDQQAGQGDLKVCNRSSGRKRSSRQSEELTGLTDVDADNLTHGGESGWVQTAPLAERSVLAG